MSHRNPYGRHTRHAAFRLLAMLFLALAAPSLMAVTITVDTLDGSGGPNNDCALSQAVLAASLNVSLGGCAAGATIGTDVIVFDPALFTGGSATINLDGTLVAYGGGLTIEGPIGDELTVNGNGTDAVMTMDMLFAAELTLRNFALNNGVASSNNGAGIRILSGNEGDLRLENMTLDGHHTDLNGGAIGGTITELININVADSVFSNNSADLDGGAIAIQAANGTTAQIWISASHFDGNTALGDGGAIRVTGEAGALSTTFNLTVSNSEFTGNSGDIGGAVQMNTFSTNHTANMTLAGNRFDSNSAGSFGGAVSGRVTRSATDAGNFEVRRNTFTGNDAGNSGGAIYFQDQSVILSNNLIAENSADRSGGIHVTYIALEAERRVSVYANTFIENFADTQYYDWYVSLPADSSLTDSRLEANLTQGLVAGADLNCWAPQPADVSASNIANNPIMGPCAANGMLVPDTGVSLMPVVHPVHEQAAVPVIGSPVVDAWPEADCIRDSGSDLDDDLLGDRRDPGTGIPFDGDGNGTGDCDVGAYERPTLVVQSLEVTLAGDGGGTVTSTPTGINCPGTCQADFPDGEMVELTAVPSLDSDFDGWSGACAGTGPCMVTLDQARSVTATFSEVTVPIEVEVIGNGTIESVPAGINCPGSCQATFDFNAEISLFAVADSGWSFFNWGGDCTGSMICQVTLDEPKHVIAIFGDADLLFLDDFE